MLELKNINKIYKLPEYEVTALSDVSVAFRPNEYVAVLGPSGCGKTTLLNIIGGLDKYTSGDLLIDGVTTKDYHDVDWDTYRNHSIGFIFQNYNLIAHQTVLKNVELALTLTGIPKQERRERAIDALEKVGLKREINKKPNQLSGGQTQRVAIARALVNNPEIILADEPTGALDSVTSIQVMDVLKEVAKDRLVIMVTHNAEIATRYATRTIMLSDGKIISDSMPVSSEEADKIREEALKKKAPKEKKQRKSAMSFWTAFSLSLNNLMTKKARTILTAFAGSIGIIGIALILSLSHGFNSYVNRVQEDTLSSYPITLEEQSLNMQDLMKEMMTNTKHEDHDLDQIHTKNIFAMMLKTLKIGFKKNDLATFKKYLDNNEEIKKYVNDIQYIYNIKMNIYSPEYDEEANQCLVPFGYKFPSDSGINPVMFQMALQNLPVWEEMMDNQELLEAQYELIGEGSRWPENYREVVVVVNKNNEITDNVLYSLGLKKKADFDELIANLDNEDYSPKSTYSYEDVLGLKYKLICEGEKYKYNATDEKYEDISDKPEIMKDVLDNALDMKVVGIIRAKKAAETTSISGAIGYKKDLIEYIIDKTQESPVLLAQKEDKTRDVITGKFFNKEETPDEIKHKQAMDKLGYAETDKPFKINIYPKTFEDKDKIDKMINEYNDGKDIQDQIKYNDIVAIMMKSVTTIINSITYVLIAFVSVSLIVSSIMIGIITYISVLERTKEIGILRSIGARKKDISRVFTAETVIVGLAAGLLGVIITDLLNIPISLIIKHFAGINNVAKLPPVAALILVVISVLLTYIAGLIPSRLASKKDPVIALRTE